MSTGADSDEETRMTTTALPDSKTLSPFTEDYYLRGPKAGLSNYNDYRWLPQLTIPVCKLMAKYLGAMPGERILDYGCARGYYVKALRGLGYDAWGYDISEWAIENCDPDISSFVSNSLPGNAFGFLLCKDVLEHVPPADLAKVLGTFLDLTQRAALIIVPLGKDGEYASPADRADVTHKICWTLPEWLLAIQFVIDSSGRAFTVSGGFKMPGVKKAADPYPGSCAFILLKRFQYE